MAWKDKRGLLKSETGEDGSEESNQAANAEAEAKQRAVNNLLSESLVDDDRGLQRRHFVDTTLLVHFFGHKGKNQIRYEDFRK